MSMEKIPNAFLDNAGVERIALAIHQTTVGIGSFDGYVDRLEDIPVSESINKRYLVAEGSTSYLWNGSSWDDPVVHEILAIGAMFHVLNDGKISQIGRFTSKPQYSYDGENVDGVLAHTGECELESIGSGRALSFSEIDDLLAAAGF